MKTFSPITTLFFLGFLLLLQACEEDVTDKFVLEAKPKLVVTSFISPQDPELTVKVSKARPLTGVSTSPEAALVRDATVMFSDGSASVRLSFDADRQLYRVNSSLFPIQAEKKYTLEVSTPEGFAVSSHCTVPSTDGIAFTDLKFSVVTKTLDPGNSVNESTFTYKWQDAPGKNNYYHAFSLRQYTEPYTGRQRQVPLNMDFDKAFLSDEKQDGQVLTSLGQFFNHGAMDDPRPLYLQAHLSVTDRHYYQYHRTVVQQREASSNPFAEPVFIYSNIQGGLGVFAAYNQIKAVLEVE